MANGVGGTYSIAGGASGIGNSVQETGGSQKAGGEHKDVESPCEEFDVVKKSGNRGRQAACAGADSHGA